MLELLKHAVLAHPDMELKFIVCTDPSKSGLGAWIGQYHGEELVIVNVMSKYAILKCLKEKEMVMLARAVWEVLGFFGIPKII